MKNKNAVILLFLIALTVPLGAQRWPVDYVNPFLGTAPLTNPADIGFKPPWRVWAGLVFPGASVPNAMVQLSPITKFGSGAGYEYENPQIYAFAHTNKGHWNLCNIPFLPVSGSVDPNDFASNFSHKRGLKIARITLGGQTIDGYFVNHENLKTGKELVITTQ